MTLVTTSLRLRAMLLAVVWLVGVLARAQEEETAEQETPVKVTFVNEMPDTSIELFWETVVNDERVSRIEGTILPRGDFIEVDTFVGHEFSYEVGGERHWLETPPPNSFGQHFFVLAGSLPGIRVRCLLEREFDMEKEEGLLSPALEIIVKPYWAPRGASRFLELVRAKYYDGVALNRVVPGFLTQFGIAKDYDQRMEWDERTIIDDVEEVVEFQPGHVSFAGSDRDSRTTEIFIVMPGTDQEQLDYFGTNSWETPFAMLDTPAQNSVLTRIYDGYGDMPPWGNGPDPDKIYGVDGYTTYLQNFPKLDYIERCFIVDEEGLNELAAEL